MTAAHLINPNEIILRQNNKDSYIAVRLSPFVFLPRQIFSAELAFLASRLLSVS